MKTKKIKPAPVLSYSCSVSFLSRRTLEKFLIFISKIWGQIFLILTAECFFCLFKGG